MARLRTVGSACLFVACLLLLHTVFSSLHYQHLVDELYGIRDVPLPLDVWIETCAFLILGLIGSVALIGPLKPAVKRSSDAPERLWDHHKYCPNFVTLGKISGQSTRQPMIAPAASTGSGKDEIQDLD